MVVSLGCVTHKGSDGDLGGGGDTGPGDTDGAGDACEIPNDDGADGVPDARGN